MVDMEQQGVDEAPVKANRSWPSREVFAVAAAMGLLFSAASAVVSWKIQQVLREADRAELVEEFTAAYPQIAVLNVNELAGEWGSLPPEVIDAATASLIDQYDKAGVLVIDRKAVLSTPNERFIVSYPSADQVTSWYAASQGKR